MTEIKIYAPGGYDEEKVMVYAEKLNVEILREWKEEYEDLLLLQLDEEGASLRRGKLRMQGDYTNMLSRVLPGKLQQEKLAKAAKMKDLPECPRAIDATAGMGEDSLIIAAAGYEIDLYEKDPVIAILLEDTLRRAKEISQLTDIVNRMHLVEGDSIEAMLHQDEAPDLIYLDPMFPARTKSGLIKKKFQLLQQLESPCSDGDEMLQAAIAARPRKIIIKRPQKGELLGGMKPSYQIPGKAIRYDCLLFPR